MTSIKRIKDLNSIIIQARQDYYNSQPTMSDQSYDALVDELAKLDPNNTAVVAIGAPVPVVSEWKKAKHPNLTMTSLNKVNTPDELKKWSEECEADELFLTEKLDGLSINTVWDNGVLIQAISRGNGSIGEEITSNVVMMKGIPKKLKKFFTGSLRGEIILRKSDHSKYFSEYSNPRNAASGIAKRLDGKGCEHLSVIMYQAVGEDFKTEKEQFIYLTQLGVEVPHYNIYRDVDGVIKEWSRYQTEVRQSLDYDIDGLVVRVNNLTKQQALGMKAHRPKGATAFKFEAEARETTLLDIVWQVGPTGRITPVAEFDTIELVDAKISRASLYNYSQVKELGVNIGATVIVSRRNDVIPAVEEVIKSTGTIASYPKKCPECKSATQFIGEYLICTGKTICPAQKLGRLQIWISEHNILDWSTATLERVIEAGLVEDIADLYKLKAEQLEKLERMGPKLAKKLVDILNQHREVPLEKLLGGLGIEGVATSTSKLIIDSGYDSLESIYKMTLADFESIKGFGSVRARNFYEGLISNKDRIKDILSSGVSIKSKVKGKLNGSYCFTGASNLPRAQLQKLVEENGGQVKKSVGKGLNWLVVADPSSTSNKMKNAIKYGTKIISEKEFMDMVND